MTTIGMRRRRNRSRASIAIVAATFTTVATGVVLANSLQGAGAADDHVQFLCAYPGSTVNTAAVTGLTAYESSGGNPGGVGGDHLAGIAGVNLELSAALANELRAGGVTSLSGNFTITAPAATGGAINSAVSSTAVPATAGTVVTLFGQSNTTIPFRGDTGLTLKATAMTLSLSSNGSLSPKVVNCGVDPAHTDVLLAVPPTPCLSNQTPAPGHYCLVTPTPAPPTTPTPIPTASPTPPPSTDVNAQMGGSMFLAAPNAHLAVEGMLTGRFNSPTFNGSLTLKPVTTQVTVFGFLPIQLGLTFSPAAAATGSYVGGTFTLNAPMNLNVPSMTFFGFPFGGGTGCRASSPMHFSLSVENSNIFSTEPGSLAYLQGGFTLAPLNNLCGFLGATVSAALTGPGNALGLLLQPSA